MAQLIVRRVDEELVRALRLRAAGKNRSAEAEHRELLREVLLPKRAGGNFRDYLLSIPAGASPADFRRNRHRPRGIRFG